MAIFNSYVKLPEGTSVFEGKKPWLPVLRQALGLAVMAGLGYAKVRSGSKIGWGPIFRGI